ncbi:MAG TPA: ADOP family duplicated permease [Gemmatimonadales bacterium]|jgi:putative ABC transport system permease protein
MGDLRVALRRMRRAPVLAAAIVLTIGLGLGAAAAIFATSEAALIEPLPYAHPERLVHLWEQRAGTGERSPTSYPTLVDWRSGATSFSALEGYDPTNFTVGVGDEARVLRGAQVTAGFFRLLGVRMGTGRDFAPDEDVPGAAVAIVSTRLAREHTITINGTPYVVVGTLPPAFHFALLQDADIFVPFGAAPERRADRFNRSIYVVGRLQGRATLARARAELARLMTALASEHPDALAGRTVAAVPLRDALLGTMKPILAGLVVAAAFLLVIMGANLALLMLTRYAERTPELAMRSALGATRARVLRQLLVESLVPSLAGAAVATAIGQLATRGLLAAIPDGVRINLPYLMDAGLDGRVIAVIVGVAIMLAIGFGLAPALGITKVSGPAGDLRTTLGRGDRRFGRGLVVAQMALTVVLLVSAGLLVVSLGNLVRRDLGFRAPDEVVTVRAPLTGSRYAQAVAQRQFYQALLARSAVLPGVRYAALIDEAPGGGGGFTTFEAVDRPSPRSQQPRALVRIVGGDYFATLGIPLVAGRVFDSRDRSDTPPAAIVSAGCAQLLAKDGAIIGRRLRLVATDSTEWEVVGVVGDVQATPLDTDTPPVVYVSHLQLSENRMMLVMRTQLGVSSVAGQIRAIVRSLDPGVPVYGASTLDQQLSQSKAVFSRRFPLMLCGVFAAAALALTLVALYAICLHQVLARRREFGIRLALGGAPGSLRRLLLADGMLLSAAGIGMGVMVAALVTRSLRAILFGIAATDWRVYGVVAVGVLAAALLAMVGPVLRAGSVNPGVALRAE